MIRLNDNGINGELEVESALFSRFSSCEIGVMRDTQEGRRDGAKKVPLSMYGTGIAGVIHRGAERYVFRPEDSGEYCVMDVNG